MKTEILSQNNYPFKVEPEAITTQFALFKVTNNGRNDVALILSPENVDQEIVEREFAFTSTIRQECFAKGFFSYAGEKPNQHEWVSKVMPVGGEQISETDLATIRNAVWNEVYRLFKGKPVTNGASVSEKTTDVRSADFAAQNKEVTQRLGLTWLDGGPEEDDIQEPLVGKEISLRSIQPTVLLRKPASDKERIAEM